MENRDAAPDARLNKRISLFLWIPIVALAGNAVAVTVLRTPQNCKVIADLGITVPTWIQAFYRFESQLGFAVLLLGLLVGFAVKFVRHRRSTHTLLWGFGFCLAAALLTLGHKAATRHLFDTLGLGGLGG